MKKYLAEAIGTFCLVFMGTGAIIVNQMTGGQVGVVGIGLVFGLVVLAMVYAVGDVSGAHLNPAVTLGMAVKTGSYSRFLPFFAAQLLGAIAGATLVWLHFLPHWRETPDTTLKLGVFCTSPAIRRYAANFLSEVIGTFALVFVVNVIFSHRVAATGPVAGLGPILVGSLVWGIGLSFGGTTGYAVNPARDLGPRIAHAILPIAGKGSSDWAYAPIPIFGPLVGGVLAGLLARFLGV